MSGAARKSELSQQKLSTPLTAVPPMTPEAYAPSATSPPQDLSHFQSGTVDEDLQAYELATGGQRFLALFIDLIIASALVATFQSLLKAALGQNDLAAALFGQFITLMYFTLMHFNNGQTMGKKIMKIRLVPDEGGDLLSFKQAASRYLMLSFLSGFSLGFSYLGAFRRDDRKTWHDRVCKTHVIKVR